MPNKVKLEPGMIVSNEPGYYKTDGYGIEPAAIKGGERKMLGFKNLTLAPLHKDLIEVSLLTETERDYVNAYHADVWSKIGGQVEGEVKLWLEEACSAL